MNISTITVYSAKHKLSAHFQPNISQPNGHRLVGKGGGLNIQFGIQIEGPISHNGIH